MSVVVPRWWLGICWCAVFLLDCTYSRSYQIQSIEQLPAIQWRFLTGCAQQHGQHSLEQPNQMVIWSHASHWLSLQQGSQQTLQVTLHLDRTSDPFSWHSNLVQDQQVLRQLLTCSAEQEALVQAVNWPSSQPIEQLAQASTSIAQDQQATTGTAQDAQPLQQLRYIDGAIPNQPITQPDPISESAFSQQPIECRYTRPVRGLVCGRQ